MEPNKRSARISRRQMLRVSGTVLSASILAACGGTSAPQQPGEATTTASNAEPTTAQAPAAAAGQQTVIVMHHRPELTEDMQKAFETAHPNIKIEFIEADPVRFFAMYAAGNPPDLLRVQAPDIPQYLARNMLMDLTPYFDTSSTLKGSNLAPANKYYMANSPTEIGQGKIYGMVKDWSPDFTLYANTKAFEDAGLEVPDPAKPLTYQEMFDLGKKMTKIEGDRVTRWGLGYANGGEWIDRVWLNMLAETGQSLYTPDFSKMVLTSNDEARNVAQYSFNLAKEQIVSSPINPSPTWVGEDFTKGAVGLIQYGYWFSAMAESDITKGNVVMLSAPTWAGKQRDPTITATGMIMTAASKVPDAAWEVFEWYNTGDPSTDRAKSGWGVPALESQYPLIPTESPFQKQAQDVLQQELPYADVIVQFNPYLGSTVVADNWTKHLESAVRGNITFDELLQNVENDVNAAIRDGQDRVG